MDRQQIMAIILVFLMIGSSIVFGIGSLFYSHTSERGWHPLDPDRERS